MSGSLCKVDALGLSLPLPLLLGSVVERVERAVDDACWAILETAEMIVGPILMCVDRRLLCERELCPAFELAAWLVPLLLEGVTVHYCS
jgi:hypothetical protein